MTARETRTGKGAATGLRMVLVAFAATALLIVLQTAVFQLVPWESAASAKISLAVRALFLLADVNVLVAVIALARAEAQTRGLLVVGAALAAFTVLSGLLGLAASVLGADARALHETLHQMGRATSGAEPVVSIATALLVTLALGALARADGAKATGRATAVTFAVFASAALSVGFRAVRLVDSSPRSLPAAWTSWLVEVTRPALVAWLALTLARTIGHAAIAEARPDGPYRVAAEGAVRAATEEALDAPTIASLCRVAAGLSFYRVSFLLRVGVGVATTFLAVVVAFLMRADSAVFLVVAIPLTSLGTAVLLAIGLFKLLAVPRGVRARGVTIGALVALGVAVLLDAATLLFASILVTSRYPSYRVERDVTVSIFVAWPMVAVASGLSVLFVASALMRLGDKLGDDRVVGRARWVQGLALGAGATQLGAVLAALSHTAAWNDAQSLGGTVVVAAMVLVALAATVAALVMQVLLVSTARSSVLAEAAGTRHPG